MVTINFYPSLPHLDPSHVWPEGTSAAGGLFSRSPQPAQPAEHRFELRSGVVGLLPQQCTVRNGWIIQLSSCPVFFFFKIYIYIWYNLIYWINLRWLSHPSEKNKKVNGKDYPRYYGTLKMFETTNQLYKLIQYGIESTVYLVYLRLDHIIHNQYFVNPNVGLLPLILIRVLHLTISHYAASINIYIYIWYYICIILNLKL